MRLVALGDGMQTKHRTDTQLNTDYFIQHLGR